MNDVNLDVVAALTAFVDLPSDAHPADLEELRRRVVGSVGHTPARPFLVEVRLAAEGVSVRP